MTEYDTIMRGEIEKANDLFKRHEAMVTNHLARKGTWDHQLHNEMVIQIQVAWPYLYALTSASGEDK